MYPAGNLFIPTDHGQLEAILKEPTPGAGRGGAALVLHPHPLYGGTMHNKVVFRASRALNDAGLVTLRVNFRGVGASTGAHDEGRGEQDDARRGLDYLRENYPGEPITLAGFSFGARFGLEVGVDDARVERLIGIGTPVGKYEFDFLRRARKPLLLVHGERDDIGSAALIKELAASLPPEARVRLEIIPGAGHFFDEQLDELMRVITAWARETDVARDPQATTPQNS